MGFRERLLAWYDTARRDLPWRRTRDPYAIWVSEVMCQQTRVDTAIPYYTRFLKAFPSASALAQAHEDEVLALWSGLGYYRRARMLHSGVREVVSTYGGRVPEDHAARLALPGVGRYTAGAIGSIAFGREEPVVDGNVARVLTRVHGVATPLERSETQKWLWQKAAALVKGVRPGDFNQSLMELGATICTPTSPSCKVCPVTRTCVARKEGRQHELPVTLARKAPPTVDMVAVVARAVRDADAVWLLKSQTQLFRGLFGLPTAEGHGALAASRALGDAGLRGTLAPRAHGNVTHVLSHRRLRVEVWSATVDSARATSTKKLVRADAMKALGVSTLTRKILSVSSEARATREPKATRSTRRAALRRKSA